MKLSICTKIGKIGSLAIVLFVVVQVAVAQAQPQFEEMLENQKHTLELNGADIAYVDIGEGQPLIFAHGWSLNQRYWLEQLLHFSKTHRVIAYDFRGMGSSNGGDQPYEFDLLVEDLKALIERLELRQPVVVGHSQGGVTAIRFASQYPEMVKAIVAVDAPRQNWATNRPNYWLMKLAASIVDEETFLKMQVPINRRLFFGESYFENFPHAQAVWEKQFLSNSRDALIHAMGALTSRTQLSEQTIDVPSLVVVGDSDRFVSEAQAYEYRALFSESRVEVIKNAGHLSSQEQPEVFNKMLEQFFADLP